MKGSGHYRILKKAIRNIRAGWPPSKFRIWGLLCLGAIVFAAGCGGMSMVGLRPEYPPVEKGTFALFAHFVEVDSLQPTFRWEEFPRSEDLFAGSVRDITYELRIWTMIPGESGKLRYARSGLKIPCHTLDEPLEPSSKYLWSVRARFAVDGSQRVTEWGLAGNVLRNEAVPNKSCFRFATP